MSADQQATRELWQMLKIRFEQSLLAPEGTVRAAEILLHAQVEDVHKIYTRIKYQKYRDPDWQYALYSRLFLREESRMHGIVSFTVGLNSARKGALMAQLLKDSLP